MIAFNGRALRALAAAGVAAGLMTAMGLAPSAAAEKAPASAASMSGEPAQRFTKHLQAHLDELAARLEIKASQEPAWQAFSATYRDVVSALVAQRQAAASSTAELDAAGLARRRADWAAENAQKLERLAQATAKLQQALSPEQRLVLNEVARRFAQEHFAHGPMHGRGFEGHGPHCGRGDGMSGQWEHRDGPPGGEAPYGSGDGSQTPGAPGR